LIIAASVILDEGSRRSVEGLLETFEAQCCYDIQVIKLLVKEMWERIDEHADDEATSWREVLVELGFPVMIA
jgi:hypothetical protein